MSCKISIVVPIYNISSYIEQCVQSIVNQTVQPFEVILVDDCSKDDSGDICDNYAKKYSFVQVVHKKMQGGLSSARNTGILSAKGDYVLFVDGDDWIDQKLLKSYTELLAKYGECDYIHWRQMMVYPDGEQELVESYLKNSEVLGKSGKQVFAEHTNQEERIWLGVRGLFRREFLINNQLLFDVHCTYAEDEEFMPRVFFYAEKILSNEFVGYYYRANRTGSLMSTFKTSSAVIQTKIYNDWKTWIEKGGVSESEQKFFDALNFELNRRVWGLYSRCSFNPQVTKKDRKLWQTTLKANKQLFEQSARVYAKGKMLKLIKFFGISKATALLNLIRKIKNKNKN